MKKLILLFLLIPSLCFAGEPLELSWMNVTTVGGGVPAAAGGCAANTLTIGDSDPSGASTTSLTNESVIFSGYVAAQSCTIDEIRLELSNNGTEGYYIRAAVYADSAGSPTGSPLAQSAQVATAGTNSAETMSITLSSTVAMTASTRYWIAIWSADPDPSVYHNGDIANGTGYMSATYHATNNFPDVAGFSDWNKQYVVSGWSQ